MYLELRGTFVGLAHTCAAASGEMGPAYLYLICTHCLRRLPHERRRVTGGAASPV
jgi:hypothetical protein